MPAALAASDYSCSHFYPNNGCYNGNNSLSNHVNPANQHTNWVITETNPHHYNTAYDKTNVDVVSGWHLLCGWTTFFFKKNGKGLIWFSLFGYKGYTIEVGLFHNSGAAAPWRIASQIRNLAHLIPDLAANALTFTPGKIDCTASGLPAGSWQFSGGALNWLQTANGDFWGLLQNEQNQLSGSTTNVHLAFGTNCTLIEDYSITGTNGIQTTMSPPRTTLRGVKAIDVNLGTEFRVIHVKK